MSAKARISALVRSFASWPGVRQVVYAPAMRRRLQRHAAFRFLYGQGWELLHPFDVALGIDTSGYVPSEKLPGSSFSQSKLHVYGGSQPSIIRSALRTLPDLSTFTFVDLGCGKGRPMIVAAEFPFRAVVGVELSEILAQSARANIAIVRERGTRKGEFVVNTGDAATFDFPTGNLLVFLYNPFGAGVMRRVVANLEAIVLPGGRRVVVVYYNPVHGICFDASPVFSRYQAGTFPYAEEELGFGPDDTDPLVIWQAGRPLLPPQAGADLPIRVVKEDYRCELG